MSKIEDAVSFGVHILSEALDIGLEHWGQILVRSVSLLNQVALNGLFHER